MADIFVSYTSSDRDWAFWIARELEALGHVPHIHEWEIKGGDDIYAWMERRHDAADHVLCVVSDEYLKSPYSAQERDAALWQAAAQRPGFVLLVTVKPCRFPTLIDHFRRCDLYTAVSEDERRARFRDFMASKDAPARVVLPAYAVSNIPIRVPEHFLGRDDALAAIATALSRYEGRVAITTLHGLRGVGKTTLAAAYAERHRGDYRATWWIRAQTADGMRADLTALGVRLGWIAADEKEEPALAAVMERLRHEGEGVLLIYDNAIDAEALRPFLPRGGAARVLVTSNAHAWRGLAEPVEIRLWPATIGADYLVARTARETEREAALALSEALGGLPLAHEQAAAYCEDLGIGLGEYRRRFETATVAFLDDPAYAPAEYHPEHAAEHRDRLTVAGTFRLAIEQAAKRHPAAEPLIVHCALLAPEPIPLFLFSEGREKFGEPLASALAGDGLDKAVAALRAFALVDRETIPDERERAITTDCIRLHRLVRHVAAERSEGQDALRRALVEALAAAYPENVFTDPKAWPPARRLDALVLALVDGEPVAEGAEARIGDLLSALGSYKHSALAAYAPARSLNERALALREKVLGPEHLDTVSSLNNLGILLHAQGDLAQARSLLERALALREKGSPDEHALMSTALNNLAAVLRDQGDLAAARPLCERTLAVREKAFGPEHPDTARSLNDLAVVVQAQGDLAAARPLLERAVAIREKTLGPEHPETARSLNNLACALRDLGQRTDAEPLFRRSIEIGEKLVGDHPDVATRLSNLACLLRDLGQTGEAEGLFRRAIAIGDKTLGAAHPLTQRYRSHYARLLLMTGRPAEALRLGEVALAAHEKAAGRSYLWTKDSALVSADALDALGRVEEARALRAGYGIAGQAD